MALLNTLSIVGGVAMWGFGRLQKRREDQLKALAKNAPIGQVEFEDPADVAEFTRLEGERRHFQDDVRRGVLHILESRSLEPIPPTRLSSDPDEVRQLARLGSFYRVVPLDSVLAQAGHVVRECERAGACVVASLSIITLPLGTAHEIVLAVGGRELADEASSETSFAILVSPAAVVPVVAAPAPSEAPPSPKTASVEDVPPSGAAGGTSSPGPEAHSNGASDRDDLHDVLGDLGGAVVGGGE